MSNQTLNHAFLGAMRRHANHTCFKVRRDRGPFHDISYRQFLTKTLRLAHFLTQQGLAPGDRLIIVAPNSPEWLMTFMAGLCCGAIVVPLRHTLPPEMLHYQLQDSGACALLLDGETQAETIAASTSACAGLRTVLTLSDLRHAYPETIPLATVLSRALTAEQEAAVVRAAEQIEPNALAMILYTGLETGVPKGAIFNHGQRLQSLRMIADWLPVDDDDVAFTLLPWAQAGSLDISLHLFLAGIPSVLSPANEQVFKNLQQTSPTIAVASPFGLETFYNAIVNEMQGQPEASREMFEWALSISKAYQEAGIAASSKLREEYTLVQMTFFSQIRGRIGGRVTRFYAVGAPLADKLYHFAEALGIAPLSIYAVTEAGGFAAATRPGYQRPGASGRLVPGFQVKIADDGEVLIKSPTMVKAYWNQSTDAPSNIDPEGWLHTQDLGQVEDDGYLVLNGRKETEMLLTSGRKVNPARLERALRQSPYIAQAIVFGDGRPYVSALLVPDLEALVANISDTVTANPDDQPAQAVPLTWYWFTGDDDLEPVVTEAHPEVQTQIDRAVAAVNRQFDLGERIEKYALLDQAFSPAANELADLTPGTRRQVAQRYATQVEAMYPGSVSLRQRAVSSVHVSPQRMRELLEKEDILDAWLADAGIGFLFGFARQMQIDKPSLVHICDTVASIAQMVNEEQPLSTALIVGDPPRINRVLPPSQIQLLSYDHIRRTRKNLVTLAAVVDGLVLGYVIDKHGFVRGIHKLDIKLDAEPADMLLGPQFRHHAAISRLCEAMVFFVPSGGKQVRVFVDGQLVGRYSNGDWSPDSMPKVDEVVAQLVVEKNYNAALIQRLLGCSFQMSEENLGAIFVVGQAEQIRQHSDWAEISHHAAILDADVATLNDEELINFAKQDGATIIDNEGRFRGCMVLLRPSSHTRAEVGSRKGSRHSSAAKMSAEANCLAITVSQNGPITIYESGRRVLSL